MRLQRFLLVLMMVGGLSACTNQEELKPDPMPVKALEYQEVSVNGTAFKGLVATTFSDRARAEAAVGLRPDEGEAGCFVYGNFGEEAPLNVVLDLSRSGDLVFVNADGKAVKVYDGDNCYLPPAVKNQATRYQAVPNNYSSIKPASIALFLMKGKAAELKITEGSSVELGDVLSKIADADPAGVKLFFQDPSIKNAEREGLPDPVSLSTRVAGSSRARAMGINASEDNLLYILPDSDESLSSDGFWLKGVEGVCSIAFLRVQPSSGWSTGDAKPFMGFVVDIIEGIKDEGDNDLVRRRWWPSTKRLDRTLPGSRSTVAGPVNAVLLMRGEKAITGRGIEEGMYVQGTSYALPKNVRNADTKGPLDGTVVTSGDKVMTPFLVRADDAKNGLLTMPLSADLNAVNAALCVWNTKDGAQVMNPNARQASVAVLKQSSGNKFTVSKVVGVDGNQATALSLDSRFALVTQETLKQGAEVTLPWECLSLRPTLRAGGFFKSAQAPEDHPSTLPEGGKAIHLELADNAASIQRGLMYRTSLPENQGMIFMFESPSKHSFWMKNCLMDIDVAFIDDEGVIRTIHEMKKPDPNTPEIELESYPSSSKGFSSGKVLYAVEMSGGWFKANDIGVGDRLWLPVGQTERASN